MVTHFCLTHQSEHLARAYGYTQESVSATWMPNFHDYGLVEGIVHPVVCGVPAYLFSPLAFVQRPARWLEIDHALRRDAQLRSQLRLRAVCA